MNASSRVLAALLALLLSAFSVTDTAVAGPLRNIVLMIGDGMGFGQVDAARAYAGGPLSFESFAHQGEVTTHSANSPVTDSAAGASAMATGQKVNTFSLSVDPDDGTPLPTILEIAQSVGKRTGLVTTRLMVDATPSAFAAHNESRFNGSEIFLEMFFDTQPNVLLGGGGTVFGPSLPIAGLPYTTVTNRSEMQALDTSAESHVWGLFGEHNLPWELDGVGDQPHLSEMTQTALDVLDEDPDGFFLMVEGGRIDEASEHNDLERTVTETIEFSNSVQQVLDWAAGRDDTLIIVTSDHDTGDLRVLADNGPGVMPTVSWQTLDHTALNVPIYATGPGSELVTGVLDNTDIFDIMLSQPASGPTVPEPSSFLLVLPALTLSLGLRRRLRRRPA